VTESVTYSMKFRIPGGPEAEKGGVLQVDAYDVIDMPIPHGAVDTIINVQPRGSGKVKMMLICSDNYTGLSFSVDDGNTQITLDSPLLLVGNGAIGLLGETQNNFLFTNTDTKDANVRIFVARMAIGEPAGDGGGIGDDIMVQIFAVEESTGKLKAVRVNSMGIDNCNWR